MVIDLQNPSLIAFIQQNVKTKNLKWISILLIFNDKALRILQNQICQHLDNTLARIMNAVFYLLDIDTSLFFELFIEGSQSPLRAIIRLQDVLRLPYIIFRIFIYRVICQVHEGIFEVLVCGLFVFFGAETYQPLVTHKSRYFIIWRKSTDHGYINSKIILVAVDKHWLIYVPLNYIFRAEVASFELQLAKISKKENTAPFGCFVRFCNIATIFMFFHIMLQSRLLLRPFKLRWHEIKAFWC